VTRLDLPDLVRQRALAIGPAGQRWLDQLDGVVEALAARWHLTVGEPFAGGTASLVAAATDAAGQDCVLKVWMPLEIDGGDAFDRSVLAHQLADGRGCARLLDHDAESRAVLLERLGPNLDALGMAVPAILETVAATLREFWRPVPADAPLRTGPEQAAWLAENIVRNWDELEQPCERAIIDRALAYCGERADAFDPATAVLAHGDAHGWNTLAAGDGSFKLVDPEGLRSEPAHDLAVPMREYNEPLLAGDTARLVRERAEQLASWCDVDPDAVWQWGFVERVSTGLLALREFEGDDWKAFLEVARRSL
jgi:streptomycin 6-kinase